MLPLSQSRGKLSVLACGRLQDLEADPLQITEEVRSSSTTSSFLGSLLSFEVGIMPILQVSSVRLGEAKWRAVRSHGVKCQSCFLAPVLPGSKAIPYGALYTLNILSIHLQNMSRFRAPTFAPAHTSRPGHHYLLPSKLQ